MHRSRLTLALAATLAAALLAACATTPTQPQPLEAVADLRAVNPPQPGASAPVTGEFHFREWKNEVVINGRIENVPPGLPRRLPSKAMHIHDGNCSAPNAGSIGGIFNPTHKQHNRPGFAGMVGDLPTVRADQHGVAEMEDYISPVIKLDGPNSVIGKVLILHRDSDSWTSQPDGNAGPVIACGVIRLVKPDQK